MTIINTTTASDRAYRCCRRNEIIAPGEAYETRERTVTRHQFNSGRDYKVKTWPRYHADETICDRIRYPAPTPNHYDRAEARGRAAAQAKIVEVS